MAAGIAKEIWRVREEHGLTLQQLADRLGCTQPYISMILRGDRIPGRKWVARFAQEFNLDLNRLELLCGRVPKGVCIIEGEINRNSRI